MPNVVRATLHNGRLAMSTTDELADYGPTRTSLTTSGNTSPASALAITRFPQTGTFSYVRTIKLDDAVAEDVRTSQAVIVVHGIDCNHNGRYDNVLGVSDLTPTLPMEATAPAIWSAQPLGHTAQAPPPTVDHPPAPGAFQAASPFRSSQVRGRSGMPRPGDVRFDVDLGATTLP